jgi:hypothetical protein
MGKERNENLPKYKSLRFFLIYDPKKEEKLSCLFFSVAA